MAQKLPIPDVVPFRCGGHDVLDFLNTVDTWLKPSTRDYLDTFEKLIAWSEASGLINSRSGRALRTAKSEQAKATLAEALDLRHTLFRTFGAMIDNVPPRQKDLSALNGWLREARGKQELIVQNAHLEWVWAADMEPRSPVLLLSLAAADLIETRPQPPQAVSWPRRVWLVFPG